MPGLECTSPLTLTQQTPAMPQSSLDSKMKKFIDNLKNSGKLKVEETDIHFYVNEQEVTSKFKLKI